MTLADWHELLTGAGLFLTFSGVWLLIVNRIYDADLRVAEARIEAEIARNEALVAEIRQRHQALREAMALWNYGAFDEAVETLQAGGWDVKVRP